MDNKEIKALYTGIVLGALAMLLGILIGYNV